MSKFVKNDLYWLKDDLYWTEYKVSCFQKSFDFWTLKEQEYRKQYGDNPSKHERKHIHAVKQYRKTAKSDLEYWQNELNKLKKKQSIYCVFS